MQILFQFDVRTVALFVAMTFLVQATVIGAQAYLIRELKQYRGVGAALLANLFVAVGLMLRLFAAQLPDFLTVIVSNVLMLSGTGFISIALGQFTGFRYSRVFVIGVIVAAVFFLVYFRYWDDDLGKRIITVSLASIVMVFTLIHQLWRTRTTGLRFSANLMLASFLVHGIFLIVRTISIIANPPQNTSGLTPAQSATYLLSFALSFFWSMGFILMVSQRLRNDLMEMATMDVLTRIPNRRATQSFLEKELSRARRQHSEFSVLLIDIDRFKQVNDKWGHATGDHILAKTADTFQSMIRKQDWVGRWGGEEFLIVLPGSPHCDVETIAERIRSEIANLKYSHGSASLGITISIGIACANEDDQIDHVLKKADNALYQAKLTRNTISMADEAA